MGVERVFLMTTTVIPRRFTLHVNSLLYSNSVIMGSDMRDV